MKKFEITKEQLKGLIEASVCNIKDYVMNNDGFIDDWMKEEFPETFKEELIIDKWHKCNYTDHIITENKSLIFVSSIAGKNINGYGFDFCGKWFDYKIDCGTISEQYQEETPQEVEVYLVKEAKKRGFKDGISIKSTSGVIGLVNCGIFIYCNIYNKLYYGGYEIFDKGKWAIIIETISKEEAEKLLNKKIV